MEINFWNDSFTTMQLKHERKMYPPRVKMTVDMRDSDVTIKLLLKVNGCLAKPGKGSLDAELNLPLAIGRLCMRSLCYCGNLNVCLQVHHQ